MLELNESTFNEIVKDNETVVIDYYTTWCPPCRSLAPKFKEWSDKYADKATFAKVNIDEVESLAVDYRINAVPTVVVFKNGNEVKRWKGLPPEDELAESIE